MFKKLFTIMFILIFIFSPIYLIFSNVIYALGVRPLIFDFNMQPGENKEFEIYLTPSSTNTDVEITFYNPIQNLSGGLNYELGDLEKHQVLNWISLDRNQVIVPAGEIQVVKGTIDVPYNASGTYIAVLMIEEVENENNSNQNVFNFQVRYAARIIINVLTPAQRTRAEIKEMYLNKNKDGNPQINAHIINTSSLYFNAEAEVTLRDSNNRLIERLNIISETASKANKLSTRIYPSSEVIFKGELNQPVYPGKYTLQVHLKYGDNQQLVERNNIILEEKLRKSGPRRYVSFEPDIISKNLKAGSPSTQVIELNNLYNEEIKIKINKKELFDNPLHSVFNIGEVVLRGGEEFLIKPSGSARSVFIFRSPRDASAGGYYGELELEVFNKNDELLEKRKIDLEMLIGEGWEYNAEMNNFKYEKNEDLQSFSLELENLSSAHISPGGVVILKNGEEQVIKTINLFAAEELKKLLPGKTVNMLGRTTQIEIGTYKAEIVLTNNNAEIKKINTSVTVN
jgi:hypothetical protein